jgi:hypothetical protein
MFFVMWPMFTPNGVPLEYHQPAASHWQTLSHNVVSSAPHHERGLELTTLVVIDTDCIGSCKSNYRRSRPRWPLRYYAGRLIYYDI